MRRLVANDKIRRDFQLNDYSLTKSYVPIIEHRFNSLKKGKMWFEKQCIFRKAYSNKKYKTPAAKSGFIGCAQRIMTLCVATSHFPILMKPYNKENYAKSTSRDTNKI